MDKEDDCQQFPKMALRPKEAARALGISPRKLWELTIRREMPHRRAGRAVLYSVDELREWLKGGQPHE
ncbi:MAG: Helix-turn-helix domain protein [Planctomycetes bacterium ADurb.Bin126]|nr:MAG: Helix-turn-helix domain protein [Planctomycetes bacterium ADurb.Bin126]